MQFIQMNKLYMVLFILFLFGAISCIRISIDTTGQKFPKAPHWSDQSELEYKVNVSQFEQLNPLLTKKDVKEILDYASLVARCGEDNDDPEDDCSQFNIENDFSCRITFTLNDQNGTGDPSARTSQVPAYRQPQQPTSQSTHDLDCDSDGIVCSNFDLDRIWDANPQEGIKVVREILFCEEVFGQWDGCSEIGGNSIAVKKPDEVVVEEENEKKKDIAYTGILWLHEFGHTKHLYHTNHPSGLNKSENAVMNANIGLDSTKLSGQECFRLRDGLP